MENNKGRKKKDIGFDSPFATRLRELLAETNTTQPMLAAAVGVSRQAVGQWKDGNTVPDILDFQKIADYFDVSLEYLAGRTDVKTVDVNKQSICEYTGLSENSIRVLHDSLTKPCYDKKIASMAFKVKDAENEYYRYFYLYANELGNCIDHFLKKPDGIEMIMLIDQYICLKKTDIDDDLESIILALQFEIVERLKHWRETKNTIKLSLDGLL